MKNTTSTYMLVLVVPWLFFLSANTLTGQISLPADFSGVQGANGVFYEQVGDSRLINTANPAPAGTSPMSYLGMINFGYPGDIALATYAGESDGYYFPNVQNDTLFDGLYMIPNANVGAAIEFQAPTAGLYSATGIFARANGVVGYGNGVDVLVVRGTNLDAPLFNAHISQNNSVDMANPFAGTGTAQFDVTVPLNAGDSLGFIVFSGSPYSDNHYDNTALRLNVNEVPEPSTLTLLGVGALALSGYVFRGQRTGPKTGTHRRT
jgi:hypothetical protein